MSVIGGVLAVLFGVFHGSAVIGWMAGGGTDDEAVALSRVPMWARAAWVLGSVTTLVGGVLAIAYSPLAARVTGVGLAVVCVLAIANGFWMKGRPTLSHHAIRFTVATVILAAVIVGA